MRVVAVAAVTILFLGTAPGFFFARTEFRGKIVIETAVLLPLILPPSVVGYYPLRGLGSGSPVHDSLGIRVLFTWPGAAIAAAFVGLPLMVEAARAAFRAVDARLEDAARTLGATGGEVFWTVTVPLARRGLLAGLVLGTARALGEFGATLTVAGNIPGRTQTLPLAVYDAVQSRNYALANQLTLILTALAFLGLWWVRRQERKRD